ncbi:MAG TPA: hypothetical protein VNV60_08535 [Holophagaceae bacterium]|jgi:hypothetical protein|nr:hypothetical protein [Holophagaceae bacterium]
MRLIPITLLLVVPLFAQESTKLALSKEMEQAMRDRMARGQEIYEYERLAWVASDMLMASHPDPNSTGMWVEVPNGDRRYIFFGRFKQPGDGSNRPEGFGAAYFFWAPIGHPDEVHTLSGPPLKPMKEQDEETKRMFAALAETDQLAQAANLIRHQPSPWKLPWNYDVFREKDGTITGYLMPGNSDSKVIPIGGDFRITLDASGTKILKTVTLHKSYLPMSTAPPAGAAKTEGMWHSHTLDEDLPPETDLGILQLFPGGVPHYLMTRYGLFVFTDKYQLRLVETKDELLKETSKPK